MTGETRELQNPGASRVAQYRGTHEVSDGGEKPHGDMRSSARGVVCSFPLNVP